MYDKCRIPASAQRVVVFYRHDNGMWIAIYARKDSREVWVYDGIGESMPNAPVGHGGPSTLNKTATGHQHRPASNSSLLLISTT
jgi:hypothetical protein